MKKADLDVLNIVPAGQKHIVSVRYTSFADNISKSTNLPIAAFTTAHARIKLYELLEKVNQRVLYCDTDSCVFVAKDGEEVPETGRFLGDLTDEIGAGITADSFVCTGAKSYAVRLIKRDGSIDHILKAKGLTLSNKTKDIINFDSMLKIVLDKIDKDAEEEKREWLTADGKYYNMIKDTDLTAIAVKQMKEDPGVGTLHHKVFNDDETNKPYINTEKRYIEAIAPSMTFRSTKKGEVSVTNSTKKLRMTSTKRSLVKNSARTVPFGNDGPLLSLM